MVKYTLVYFKARGKAELARLVLAQAGASYEDRRIDCSQWSMLRPSTPFGQLPVLEVDGQSFSQSKAIARYLAGEFHLRGPSTLTHLECDMIVDCIDDLMTVMIRLKFESNEQKKTEIRCNFFRNSLPSMLEKLERRLDGRQFFIGDSVTLADLAFMDGMDWVLQLEPQALDTFSQLKALNERVRRLPNIAAWLQARPLTPF